MVESAALEHCNAFQRQWSACPSLIKDLAGYFGNITSRISFLKHVLSSY